MRVNVRYPDNMRSTRGPIHDITVSINRSSKSACRCLDFVKSLFNTYVNFTQCCFQGLVPL